MNAGLFSALTGILVLLVLFTVAPGLIWLERRLLGLWQDRYGPNRVGPFGSMQVLADMIKMFWKEDWIPPFADRKIFFIAPGIVLTTVLRRLRGGPDHAGHRRPEPECRAPLFPGDVVARGL